jgi:hypothetical protein
MPEYIAIHPVLGLTKEISSNLCEAESGIGEFGSGFH